MEISITQKGCCSIIEPREEVLFHNSSEFKNHINDILENGFSTIIIDLSNIRFADTALIGSLLFAFKKAQLLNKKCCLINVSDNVRKIMKISNLESFFSICEDDHEYAMYFCNEIQR